MSFTWIPNDNLYDELAKDREKNSQDPIPHQQVPPDILVFYMVFRRSFDHMHNLLASTVRTFFSTSETLVSRHRIDEMQRIIRGTGTPPPNVPPNRVERVSPNGFIWRFSLGIYSTLSITEISSRTRPNFVPRTAGINRIDFIDRSF